MNNTASTPVPDEQTRERNRWILCWLLFVATALSFLDRQVLSILSPTIMLEFHMDSATYGLVVASFQLSYTIMFTYGGRLVDRFGTGLGLGVAVAVWSLASGFHAFAAGWIGLALARFALGFGEGACFPGATKGAVEWFPAEKRVLAIGIANGGSAFGAVLAPPLTAGLMACVGWRGVFVATAVVGAVWVVAWFWAVRRFAPPAQPQTAAAGTSVRRLLNDRRVLRILASRFLFDPVVYFYLFWIPQYLSRERGFSVAEIGQWFWLPFLALGIGNIFSGKATETLLRTGLAPTRARAMIMITAAVISTVSWFVPVAGTPALAIGFMATMLFVHGFWITNFLGLIGDNFESHEVATVIGLSGTAGGCAAVFSSIAIGAVVDQVSYTPVFVVMGLLYPLSIAVLLRRPWRAAGGAAGKPETRATVAVGLSPTGGASPRG